MASANLCVAFWPFSQVLGLPTWDQHPCGSHLTQERVAEAPNTGAGPPGPADSPGRTTGVWSAKDAEGLRWSQGSGLFTGMEVTAWPMQAT